MERHTRRRALSVVVCFLLASFTGPATTAPAENAGEPVISLDYTGDRLARSSEEPRLSIFADGVVRLARVRPQDETRHMQISMQELQALIDFIREQGFFDPVAAASAHSADSAQESHPATTIVTVRDGEVRTRSVTDLRHAPRQDGFRAIVTRLERLIDITLLGGYPAAEDWLTRANAELAAVHPAAAPLTLADFASGARRIDGSVNVVFARELDGVKVSMAVDAAGRYGVAVFPQP